MNFSHRIAHRFVLLIVLALGLFAMTADARAEPILQDIRGLEDTIERIDPATGQRRWKVVHPSVWEDKARTKQISHITEPILVDGRLYYGLRNWLIRLDPDKGVIEKRHWFPAEIVDLAAENDALAVTVEAETESRDNPTQRVRFAFQPGTMSPQEIWDYLGLLMVWKDASYLGSGIYKPDYEYAPGEREADLAALRERSVQEPNNPFYDFFTGWLHQQAGEEDLARAAFEKAVSTRGGHWTSWLQLTSFLDDIGQLDFADRAFKKSRRLIEDNAQVHIRRSPSLVAYMMLMGWSSKSVDQAVRDQEFERVDRVLERTARAFPYLENSSTAWRLLADWYAEYDHPKLAEKWRAHAQRADQSPMVGIEQATRTADLALALIISLMLGVWIAVLAVAIRRARPARTRGWLAQPTRAELAGLALALLLPFPLLFVQQAAVDKIGTIAEAPLVVFNDGWTSPDMRMWLEALHPGQARDALLERTRAIAEATRQGQLDQARIEVPDHTLLIDAIEADARQTAWAQLTNGTDQTYAKLNFPPLHLLIPGWALSIAFLLVLGGFLGHRFPRLQALTRYVVPGGARSAGFFTPFLITLTIAAVGSLAFGLDTILQRIAQPAFGKFFGLDSLYTAEALRPSHWRATITLVVVLILHGVTLWWDKRSDSPKR